MRSPKLIYPKLHCSAKKRWLKLGIRRRTKRGSIWQSFRRASRFSFFGLIGQDLRPAVVLARANRQDWFLCQITSNAGIDQRAIELKETDFAVGSLRQSSFARPDKIFTGHEA